MGVSGAGVHRLYLLDVVGGPERVARPFLDSAERLAD